MQQNLDLDFILFLDHQTYSRVISIQLSAENVVQHFICDALGYRKKLFFKKTSNRKLSAFYLGKWLAALYIHYLSKYHSLTIFNRTNGSSGKSIRVGRASSVDIIFQHLNQ